MKMRLPAFAGLLLSLLAVASSWAADDPAEAKRQAEVQAAMERIAAAAREQGYLVYEPFRYSFSGYSDRTVGREEFRNAARHAKVGVEITAYATPAKALEVYRLYRPKLDEPGLGQVKDYATAPRTWQERERCPDGELTRTLDLAVEIEKDRLSCKSNLTWCRLIPNYEESLHFGSSAGHYVIAVSGNLVMKLNYNSSKGTTGSDKVALEEIEEINVSAPNHLEEVLALARSFFGAAPAAATSRVFTTLTADPVPAEVKADGRSLVKINLALSECEENARASAPVKGAEITAEIAMQDGVRPGRLAQARVTTDAQGRAVIAYTAPKAEELLDGRINNVEIRLACAALGIKESVYVTLVSDQGKINVDPHYGGSPWSSVGVIPADKRFPATIEFYLEDEKMKPIRNTIVTFALTGKEKRGLLSGANGRAGVTVEVTTDDKGYAEATYTYAGPAELAQAFREEITITAKGMAQPKKAFVSVGIDLAIRSIRNMHEGKGELNAREEVPLAITVYDAFHPEARDLTAVLRHWVGRKDNGPALGLRLAVDPAGNLPRYLIERSTITSVGNPPFDELVGTLYDAKKKETVLWMTPGGSYEGCPRVTPRYTGANYYTVTVSLAELQHGTHVADPQPKNSTGILSIPCGVPADEWVIFYLDDPFGPNTKQARIFREILDIMGYGVLLKPTEITTALNKGDFEGLMASLVGLAHGKLIDKIKDVYGGLLPAELMDAYADLTITERMLAVCFDLSTADSRREEELVKKLMAQTKLKGLKLVTVVGTGTQALKNKKTGELIPASEGAIVGALEGPGTLSLRQGKLSIYIVPVDLEVEPVGAASVHEYRK